ncbi:MAG: PrsW family intramembrane metalloprotease [Bacteroidota bacterium]
MSSTDLLLPALFIIYLIHAIVRVVRSYITSRNKRGFLRSYKFKRVIQIILIIGIPLIIVSFLPAGIGDKIGFWPKALGYLFSAAISILWVVYIRKLDIYEPEKWRHILFVFILSCLTIWAIFPITNGINSLGFELNGNPVNDFLYSVITIGMMEELVKLIPVLIIMLNKKILNESFDFLLYASVSALGFAFIENILYINSSELYSVIARMLVASVAHMTFTTTIFYGFLLAKRRRFKAIPKVVYYVIFFLLASLSHGFYDYWLLNPWANQFHSLTIIFFMVIMHIWFTMLNNALNISQFYKRSTPLQVDKLKSYLIFSLLMVFMAAFLTVHLFHGKQEAMLFFWENLFAFGYFFIYIIYSHNRFKIVRGYIAPFEATSSFFVPPLKRVE